MKICSNCQLENPPQANFCNNCGASLKGVENGDTLAVPGDPKKAKRMAERRQLTILFCDLVGSTALSEQMDPEDYRQMILDYQQVAEKEISRHGGHVGNYLGDGLLVYFGYPEGLEDAPRAGVRAGLGIIDAVAEANQTWEAAGKMPIKVRIGIHTGLVVVDDHLALGETVNVAARLEGLAPHNGLVISPQTRNLVEGWFEVESIGKHTLKGISEAMEVFQVVKETGVKTRLDIARGRGLSPLVGREQELRQLQKRWEAAKKGKGSLLLLNGEAGIGKSRLVDTIEARVSREPDQLLLEARCSAYQQNSAFHPIIELLEKVLLQFESSDDPSGKLNKLERFLLQSNLDLKTTMPLMAEFLAIPSEEFPPLVMSPIAKRQRVMEMLSQVLLKQATDQPVLFVLEDLHWADASTREWLSLFLEQLSDHSIFSLCTTRPGYRPDWLEHSGVTHITLQRLSPEDMVQICHHQTKGKALPKEILKQITHKTEGVPLFVEELTKMIMESDFLVEKDDGYEASEPVSSLDIPSTLQDSLLARLDRLSNVKEVAQVGAVLGREFSFDLLKAVLPQKEGGLEQSLSKLLDAEIFQRRPNGQQPVYQFKHALIQDTAYDSMLKSRRQQLHHRVANVLEHQFEEINQTQPELLAHHYTEAGLPLQAIPIWLKAGHLAGQKNANSEAIAHLEKGMGLLSHVKAEAERNNLELDFRLALGGAFMVTHGFPHPKVGETFNRAREIAQTIEVSPKLGFVLMNLMTFYVNREAHGTTQEIAEYMLELSKDQEDGYLFKICGIYYRGAVNSIMGNFIEGIADIEEAIKMYDPAANIPLELTSSGDIKINYTSWWMIFLQIVGHLEHAKQLSEELLASAKNFSDSRTLYHIYTFPALYHLEAKEWEASVAILEKYLPIVKEFGDPIFMLTAEVYYNVALAFQGDKNAFEKAVHLMNVALDVGFKAFAVTLSPYIGEQYYRLGEFDSALAWIEKILAHTKKNSSHLKDAELLRIKGLTLQAMGKPDAIVEETLQQALELARQQSAKTFELRTAAALARRWQKQGKSIEGFNLLKEVYDWFSEGFDSVDLREATELLEELNEK